MDYKIKCINEDFQVTEVPLIPHFARKRPYKYSYFWLQKSGFTTFEALDLVKDFFGLKFEDVGSQGLKDEDAITEQLISLKQILSDKDGVAFNKKHQFKNKFARIKAIVGYGNEPVKERMLHGNSFRIVIRNIKEVLAQNALDYVSSRRHHHLINYYDNQRFGMPGGPYNTHLIGKALTENGWKQAYELARITNNSLPREMGRAKSVSEFKEAFKLMNPKKLSFFVSSYNSFLWNKEASLTVKKHSKSKPHQFPGVGSLHLPVDHVFQCPHTCEAKGYEFLPENFAVRRKINVRNIIVTTTVYGSNLESDELHNKRKKLTLSFFLPTGSYATMMVRQLFLRLNVR